MGSSRKKSSGSLLATGQLGFWQYRPDRSEGNPDILHTACIRKYTNTSLDFVTIWVPANLLSLHGIGK